MLKFWTISELAEIGFPGVIFGADHEFSVSFSIRPMVYRLLPVLCSKLFGFVEMVGFCHLDLFFDDDNKFETSFLIGPVRYRLLPVFETNNVIHVGFC